MINSHYNHIMKTILSIVMVSLFIFSCTAPFYINTKGYVIQEMPLEEAWQKVSSYKYIDETEDYWESPMEFEKNSGDCEDFAIELIYLLGPKSSLVIIKRVNENHAIVEYMDEYIDPQICGYYYNKNKINIILKWDYYKTMEYATRWGTKYVRSKP
jgi:hypothetical protein